MKFAALQLLVLMISVPASIQGNEPASATSSQLVAMLRQFLVDAGHGNRAGFESFSADDVIYTRAVGISIGKPDILKGIEKLKPADESKSTFSAEDITVHDYHDAAVVAFRLVARTEHKSGKVEIENYRNTGTFLRRKGRWQVVAWQATKIPETDSSAKK